MTDISRRNFMGSMVAAPMAAKQAVEAAQANVGVFASPNSLTLEQIEPPANNGYQNRHDWILKNGLPDWKKRNYRMAAKAYSKNLDPDIASLGSVSLTAKVRMQEERVYQQMCERFFTNDFWDKATIMFDKKFDF